MKINRVGAIGEIYTDPESGKMYKCIYVYKDSNGVVECDWREIVEETEIENRKISEGKNLEKQMENVDETTVDEKSDDKPNTKEFTSHSNYNPRHNKTKYTNYSKK